jgi:chemotaxis protein MotB
MLEELAVMLKQRPWHILVEDHTDNQSISTPRYLSNWELSSARATSVTRYLIRQGVDMPTLGR